jgi:hypothetical protein
MKPISLRILCTVVFVSACPGSSKADSAQTRKDEELQYLKDQRRFGSSCADLAELEKAASTVHPPVTIWYQKVIDARRSSQVRELTKKIQSGMDTPPQLEQMDSPSDARTSVVEPMTALVTELRCDAPDAAAKLQPAIDGWMAGIEKQIADEEKCRKTPKCMADRIAVPLCGTIADRRDATQQLAKEKGNPSGVVDLSVLHDLGQRIQEDNAAIADLKKQYASITHRAFNETLCPK